MKEFSRDTSDMLQLTENFSVQMENPRKSLMQYSDKEIVRKRHGETENLK